MSELLALHRHGPAIEQDGPLPLVLLHAFPLDSRMWEGVVAHLPELPVVTVDAPGFGSSPSPAVVAEALARSADPSLETCADAVAASLHSAGIGRAVVAGLSMGGYTVLALAERHRSLLAGVGLLDTKAEVDADAARANRLRVAEEAEGPRGAAAVAPMVDQVLGATTHAERPAVVDQVRGWLAEAPADGIAWAQRAMAARPARSTALEDLEVPALVLRGAEDETAPQSAAQSMADPLHDVEVVVVPRAGHMSAVEDPAAVAAALSAVHGRAERRH